MLASGWQYEPVAVLPSQLQLPTVAARRTASKALIGRGGLAAPAIPMIRDLIKTEDDLWVRGQAVEVLRAIGTTNTAAMPALAIALADEHEWIRTVAVEALGAWGPQAKPYANAISEIAENDGSDSF